MSVPTKNKPSRLIPIDELCHRTGLAPSTVWRKVRADEIVQPIRVSRGVTRWLESDVDAWIESLIEGSR